MDKEIVSFLHLGIAPAMLEVLDKLKFISPTPIQYKAIPLALQGKDIVGIAQTGTGKTMAFGIPLVQKLAAQGGRGLILVPTRELAMQVDAALIPLTRAFGLKSSVLIGGMPMGPQLDELRQVPQIIIATPGRLLDHIFQGKIDFAQTSLLVIDEADRMYDLGFASQVDQVIRCLPPEHQTLLFSATMPTDVVKLAAKNMKLPIQVEIAPPGTTIEKITQELFIAREDVKPRILSALLGKYQGPTLVFTRTKSKASRVARQVRDLGEKVAELHSDRSMSQRMQAIDGFKLGRYRVLVATDVAARGIDVRNIELVVNYDLPDDIENYVHRIGRTGRAGREGRAVSFAVPQQIAEVAKIEQLIRKPLPRGKATDLEGHHGAQSGSGSTHQRSRRQQRPRSRHPSKESKNA
jgi:ATP-dependent RNA helicase RhlE